MVLETRLAEVRNDTRQARIERNVLHFEAREQSQRSLRKLNECCETAANRNVAMDLRRSAGHRLFSTRNEQDSVTLSRVLCSYALANVIDKGARVVDAHTFNTLDTLGCESHPPSHSKAAQERRRGGQEDLCGAYGRGGRIDAPF